VFNPHDHKKKRKKRKKYVQIIEIISNVNINEQYYYIDVCAVVGKA
jgi:hypothetical protein